MSGQEAERELEAGGWRRLHPLSLLVRTGRASIAILLVVIPSLLVGRHELYPLAFIGVVVVTSAVSWIVTRWRVTEGTLRIETGLFRRQSLRIPLQQIQAIDTVRPGLARLFGVAELRLRMAGRASTARLAYLPSGRRTSCGQSSLRSRVGNRRRRPSRPNGCSRASPCRGS